MIRLSHSFQIKLKIFFGNINNLFINNYIWNWTINSLFFSSRGFFFLIITKKSPKGWLCFYFIVVLWEIKFYILGQTKILRIKDKITLIYNIW